MILTSIAFCALKFLIVFVLMVICAGVGTAIVIGIYPTLTNDQLVSIVKEYEKNPEPKVYYFVYDETKRDVIYRQGE